MAVKLQLIRVRALRVGNQVYSGYYNHVRRRPGDVFDIFSEDHFSARWMQRVPQSTPKTDAPGEPRLEDLVEDGFIQSGSEEGVALSEYNKPRPDNEDVRRAKEATLGPAAHVGKGARR